MSNTKTENLQLKVPAPLKRKLAMDAAAKGVTIRALILKALANSGYKISDDEIRDKRKSD